MFNNEDRPIRAEWEEYYQMLEVIRKSGITNMYGAAPYLKEFCPELSHEESKEILLNWMANYNALNAKYNWQ